MKNLKIFTDNIEEAIIQINKLLEQTAFKNSKVRIMPNVHAGKNCVIGFTGDLGSRVIPNIVGGDIGCGMFCAKLGIIDIDYEKSMKHIYTTSVNKDTIDEFPFAYKSMKEILEKIIPTVEVTNIIKPVYNFKASEY